MTRIAVFPVLVSMLVLGGLAGPAPAHMVTDLDRFRLWNACKPVELIVKSLTRETLEVGLTRASIAAAARGNYRGADLFSDDFTGSFL